MINDQHLEFGNQTKEPSSKLPNLLESMSCNSKRPNIPLLVQALNLYKILTNFRDYQIHNKDC